MKALWLGILLTGFTTLARAADPTIRPDLGGGTGIDLLLVPAGEFTQGSPADEPGRGSDENQRTVRHTPTLYFSRTAITRGQWERFIAETHYRTEAEIGTSGGYGWDGNALVQRKEFTWKNPGFPQDATHPVCLVTHDDAKAFCQWLEKKTHRKTTLPTEAQWEYACRAGTTTPWHSGASSDSWHKGNSGNGTHPADSNAPNAWGLIIGGNVSEWCLDWYGPYETTPQTDPRQGNPNLSDKSRRVLRGGSWNRDAKNTRSASRFRADPKSRNADIGFRIVCDTEIIAPAVITPQPAITPPVTVEPPPVENRSTPIESPFTRSNDPSPAPAMFETQSSTFGFGSLLCFIIPIAILAIAIRLISRRGSSPSYPSMPSRPMPPTLNQQRGVRMVDNGFWIQSDWPVGTPVHLSYLVNGIMEQQTLVYQPSSQGQFIFTGTRPEKVTISGTGNQPPPLRSQPPPFSSMHGAMYSPTHRPSIRPSAY
ncbi:MAG: formylglycine-generating enzyme family protein [Luteolibacter sp.]